MTAKSNCNIRSGPSTDTPIVGSLRANQEIQVVARNDKGDWYQLADEGWVFAQLVDGSADLPLAAPSPTPAPTPTEYYAGSITGIMSGDIKVNLQNQFGMTCSGPEEAGTFVGPNTWDCIREFSDGRIYLKFYGSVAKIHTLWAYIEQSSPSVEMSNAYLGFVVSFADDVWNVDQAQEWIAKNVGKSEDVSTKIRGVTFKLMGPQTKRVLGIYAKNNDLQ